MRAHLLLGFVLACSSAPAKPAAPPAAAPPPIPPTDAKPVAPPPAPTPLAADTPSHTVRGNTFVAPAGWSLEVRGTATIASPPEPGSAIALVDVDANDAEGAVTAAWAAYKPSKPWKVVDTNDGADKDGWSNNRAFSYQTSPNEKRSVTAIAKHSAGGWTVVIIDMLDAIEEKRGAQLGVVLGRLLPKDYTRETFAGKTAHDLDAARIAELGKFIETSEQKLGVPGVALGIVQHGKVVFAGGFGVRELGKPAKVDANTMFMIASNTKALTTLMLAKLVDEKQLTWDTKVTSLLPTFKLGNAETTEQVKVRHLICACTGLPRQDLEWLFQFKGVTPTDAMATLAAVQPTSKFGEMFQYSNLLAGAAGFVGGHVAFPKLELGAAYDKAMQTRVFDPLGMRSTTFDYARALRGDHAMPHANDVDGKTAHAEMAINYSIVSLRPAGAGWSNISDMLKYVEMELDDGKVGGKTIVSKESLLERRVPQVPIGKDATYGMGLMVDTTYGVAVVHHGGDMIGFHSDMMWLPEYGVGAVVLTNGDPGWIIRGQFQRKLLEVLLDGHPEADANIASAAAAWYGSIAAARKLIEVPANAAEAGKLASHYHSDALGDIDISHHDAATTFDFGEFKSDVASRKNPDGTFSFITTSPGISDFEFVVGAANGKRTLVIRDAQHEYTFVET